MKHLIPEFEKIKARFPDAATTASSMVLPCLHRIQGERGYVAEEDIEGLVAYLGVTRVQIEEVLSFYTMLRRVPIGRHHLCVCRNVSCSMLGAEPLIEHLKTRLGIAPGETSANRRFTLDTAECLASCGTGPMMTVNGAYHESLTKEKIDQLLETLSKDA